MVIIMRLGRLGIGLGCKVANQVHFTTAQQWRCITVASACCAERRYTDKHEWVLVEGQIGTIGISNYAQETLGDVVFAQLPEPGISVKRNEECGALESVKAATEVYSPVSGQVTEKNTAIESSPALINTNCYDKGWLFKLQLGDPHEVDKLMTEDQYQNFLKSHDH